MDRRYLGQDDLPRPAAFGVRSPGERDCARHTQPLQRARARAGRRDYRGPRRCGACLQPASGGRNLEHGSPIGGAEVSVPAPIPSPGVFPLLRHPGLGRDSLPVDRPPRPSRPPISRARPRPCFGRVGASKGLRRLSD
jgi:hypothetical protein